MKVVIFVYYENIKALDYAEELGRYLAELGYTVEYEKKAAEKFGLPGVDLKETDADIVAVVGGDGSVLEAVQEMNRQVPILAINYGEVGFLSNLELGEARDFFSARMDNFDIQERNRIDIYSGDRRLGTALNEAVVVTSRTAKMLRFTIFIDGIVSESFRADGLIVSTPTGSTAYAMSAGGPIVDPRMDGYLLVPLAPYMLSSRPTLVHSSRRIEIEVGSKPARVVFDGQRSVDIGENAILSVRKSPEPALFVDTGKTFFEKVEDKLRKL